MQNSVSIKFDRRPEDCGIIWSHDPNARSYPGKLLPGYIVSARCCGVAVFLEVVDVEYEHNIDARIVKVEGQGMSQNIMCLFDGERILKLSRDNVFSCETPGRTLSRKEKSATVLLQTQQIDIFESN